MSRLLQLLKHQIPFYIFIFLSVPVYPQTDGDRGNYITVEQTGSEEQVFPNEIDGLSIWALPTNGSTSVNSRAPSNGWKYQRTEYLITPAEMFSSGFPSGAVINAVGFHISAAGAGALAGSLNIYLKNTTDTEYSLGTSWTTFGFTHVSNNTNFSVPLSPSGGSYDITFSAGTPFTYTGGGIYVAWEFNSPDGSPGTINVNHYCNTDLENGLFGNRSHAALPSTLTASNWRPATRFNTNTYHDMIDLTNIYTLERIPVPFGTPPSVGVRVVNVSAVAITFDLTLTVVDAATSTVRYTDTQTLSNFPGYTFTVVNFPGWSPTLFEDVIITASTSVIIEETWTVNNTRSITAGVNNNLYSYNFNTLNPGGYGYTHPGSGIFAAKYIMNGTGSITGINAFIYDYSANTGNTVYAVALNGAGVIVAQSDNYVIQPEDLGTMKNFTFTTPGLFHNQIFYAGLAQTTGIIQYYPLGTFSETPQRGNTFYTFPLTGGTPQVNNVLAKFGIEAQVVPSAAEVIDAGVISIDVDANQNPGTVMPKATVKNFGTNPKSFTVSISIGDTYNSVKSITSLPPGESQQVTFDAWNAALGQFNINVCTQLTGDINPDNNCISKVVGVYSGIWAGGTDFPISTYLGSGVGYKSITSEAAIGYLFSIGGNTTSGLSTECFKYNVNSGTWTAIASLPVARRIMATAVVGNNIYVIGGSDQSSIYQSTVLKYSITGNTWTYAASLPIAIAWGKAAVYKEKIYLAGGTNASGNAISSVYVYDPVLNTWSAGTSMPAARFGGAFSAAGNKLVYVGGSANSIIYGDVYVGTIGGLNPLSISWTNEGMYPGLDGPVYSDPSINLSDPAVNYKDINPLNDELESFPPGIMYRFDAAPWGTSSIILAGGSPGAQWMPGIPSPCYTYNPFTNIWTKQADIPSPVLGASIGTVNNGNNWKLIVASGLGVTQVENLTQIWTDTTAATAFQLSVSVNADWNVVSIPGLHPDNQNSSTWYPYKDPAANIFKFNSGYQPVSVLEPGIGYWLRHTGSRVYNTGDEWPAGGIFAVPHNPIPVSAGWNIIGPYEQTVLTSGVTTTPPGLITGTFYRYSAGYLTATSLVSGYGYWVKLTGSGFINIPEAAAYDKTAVYDPTEGFGKIIISDNSGKAYTLYAVKGEQDLSQFDLPPLPPQGMFDIRYSTQRYAEDLSSRHVIEMTGIEHPLKIKAENTGIILTDEKGKELGRLRSGEEITLRTSAAKILVTEDLLPLDFSLEQNYPNPFNPATIIQFSVPKEVFVNLSIYNVLGQKVEELKNEIMKPGYYQVEFNASALATGVYFYNIQAEGFQNTKKMLLIK